jgi:thioredoxin 1
MECVKELNATQITALISASDILFVDFWANWCAPCRQFAPIYAQVAEKNRDIVFAAVNIEQEHALAESFQIRSIPYLMVFKQGIAIYAESGSVPESILLDLIAQARAADVSAIRAQLDDSE